MTYILDIGIWHVGPFPTHICAQHWAEIHGVDQYRMIPLDDPAEAPARIYMHRRCCRQGDCAAAIKNPDAMPTPGSGLHQPYQR